MNYATGEESFAGLIMQDLAATKEQKYSFRYIAHCNMCGSDATSHKVLGKRLNQSQGRNPTAKIGITTTIVRCTQCGLIYSNPQPIPNNIMDHYGMPPEEYWKEPYFKVDDDYFKAEIKTLKKLYSFKLGDKALDIGAGLGKCMIALTEAGFDVQGIEPSEPFYSQTLKKTNITSEKLILSSIEDADFPVDHFDFITFGAVLEHLYTPSESIRKALTWLKKGGIMQIEVPSSDWLVSKLINLVYKLRGLDYVTNLSPMHEPFHLYEFSLKAFTENAKSNHYTILHHDYYVAQTYLPKILDIMLVPFMKYTSQGMQLCVWLKKD